jgi:hypothetical protein
MKSRIFFSTSHGFIKHGQGSLDFAAALIKWREQNYWLAQIQTACVWSGRCQLSQNILDFLPELPRIEILLAAQGDSFYGSSHGNWVEFRPQSKNDGDQQWTDSEAQEPAFFSSGRLHPGSLGLENH